MKTRKEMTFSDLGGMLCVGFKEPKKEIKTMKTRKAHEHKVYPDYCIECADANKPQHTPRYQCPWCYEDVEPVPTDDRAISNIGNHVDRSRNPAMCPECFGVGGYEDFGVDEASAKAEGK